MYSFLNREAWFASSKPVSTISTILEINGFNSKAVLTPNCAGALSIVIPLRQNGLLSS